MAASDKTVQEIADEAAAQVAAVSELEEDVEVTIMEKPKGDSRGRNVITGLDHAFVNTKRPIPNHVVLVKEGESVPADVADGELDRLAQLGAFGEHPRKVRERAIARMTDESTGFPVPDVGFISDEALASERELREAAEARAEALQAELDGLRAGSSRARK